MSKHVPASPSCSATPAASAPRWPSNCWPRAANSAAADVLLIADPAVLASGQRIAGAKLNVLTVESLERVRFEPGTVTLLARDWLQGQDAGAR